MEKNIAAFLRDDAKTVQVRFVHPNTKPTSMVLGDGLSLSPNSHTYLTTEDLAVGDRVVVFANTIMAVALVTEVDTCVDIEPNSDIQYKWVIQKVDTFAYNQLMADNLLIERTVQDAYKQTVKNQFKQILMQNLGEEKQGLIQSLLTKKASDES